MVKETTDASEVTSSSYVNFLQQFFQLHRLIEESLYLSENHVQTLEKDAAEIGSLLKQVKQLNTCLDGKLEMMQKYATILRPFVIKTEALIAKSQELQKAISDYEAKIIDSKKHYSIESRKLEAKIQSLADSQQLDAEKIKEEVKKEYSKKIRETKAKAEESERKVSVLRRCIDSFDQIIAREKEKIKLEVEKEHSLRKKNLEKNIKRYKEKLAAAKHEYDGRRTAEQTRFDSAIQKYKTDFDQLQKESSALKLQLTRVGVKLDAPEPGPSESGGQEKTTTARPTVSDQSKAKTPPKKMSKAVDAYQSYFQVLKK